MQFDKSDCAAACLATVCKFYRKEITIQMDAPRCFACDNDSSINMPAPSDITKPSRVASKGRLASAGDSFLVDNAVAFPKLAMDNSVMPASVPPANAASASPIRISRYTSSIAVFPIAHADTGDIEGPIACHLMLI